MSRRPRLWIATGLLAVMVGATTGLSQAGTVSDWSSYLYDSSHSSSNASATQITPTNAASLTSYWRWFADKPTMTGQPGPGFFASPVVANGHIYIGANTGVFYALDLATKKVLWKQFLGYRPTLTCAKRGIVSTATVATDPSTGISTVYVASPDGYLYALNAGDGTLLWKSLVAQPSATASDYFNWSSPVVANGHVYVGVSSQCDAPLVRGGVEQYDQGTGALQNSYWGTPPGVIGDSVWGTPAIGPTGDVYVTTGNGPISSDALSIVRLDGSSLAKVSRWQLPSANFKHDYDFGASPTTFTADFGSGSVPMVGACSKNGVFYALRADNLAAGPVWTYQVGNPSGSGQISCLSAAVWDGTNLYVSGPATTINGTAYQGSVQALNPATGTPVWQDGEPGVILGTPGIDGAGVIAAGTYTLGSTATNSLYLINSSDGSSLATIDTKNSKIFSQPVFADGYLVIASTGRGLFVFRP